MTVAIIVAYLLVVLAVGAFSHRLLQRTGEDWFLASRSIGPFILLMSLFGTHMTAFSLLGASGESYRTGIGVFGLMASASALVAPVVFWFVGRRLWEVGKRHGYLTQVQYFRERWGSGWLGGILFVSLVVFLVPYLLISVMGSGLTLAQISGGAIPDWVGSAAVCAVVLAYVTYGGLRGTAWANTFQTLVFMTLGAVTYVWIIRQVGGLEPAMARVAGEFPELMIRGDAIPPAKWLTYMLIPLSVGMFPHIFMHWLTARSAGTFRTPAVAYPLCVAIVWLPSVLLGVVGRADFPDLAGPQASSILVRMIDLHAPEVLAGFLAAGVFAAIMSSLDSQVLSLGTMFTHDVVARVRGAGLDEAARVRVGRWFVVGILVVTFGISRFATPSLFKLGVWSFSGFAALFPLVLAALFWKRSTRQGAIACVLAVLVTWTVLLIRGWDVPGYTVLGSGVMPVAVLIAVSSTALVVVSLLTPPPDRAMLERFFPEGT